jgi:small subunit ribosomal protein S17
MPKRVLQGVVVSDKGDKTIVVRVERRVRHPLYKKYIRSTKKYHAHDEDNACRVGETVRIIESRPHSRLKRWELLSRERAAAEVGL